MMTTVTHITLKVGAEPEWDATMQARLEAAQQQAGFVSGQILIPMERMDRRVIVGTWETRAAWEAWHADPAFADTRTRLEGLEAEPSEQWWHEVMLDIRR